jgi:hypothetical protein
MKIHQITKWFSISWYQYLFEIPFNLRKLMCRIRRHPCGSIYFSHGSEPDYRCKNCKDEL